MRLTIIRFAHKREWDNPFLARWLRKREAEGHLVRDANWAVPLDLCRNKEVARFLALDDTDAILMVDADMVPLPETDEVLWADAPVAWCPYVGQSGRPEHPEPGAVACGFLRISREAVEKIGEPWFKFVLDEKCRMKEMCECAWFSGRIRDLGIAAARLGRVGHLARVVLLPTDDGGACFKPEYLFSDSAVPYDERQSRIVQDALPGLQRFSERLEARCRPRRTAGAAPLRRGPLAGT